MEERPRAGPGGLARGNQSQRLVATMDDLDAFTGLVFGVAIGAWLWAGIVFLIYLA